MACKIRGLMVTVCPSQFATRRTLFHVLVGCGLLMLKVSRLKLPVIWLLEIGRASCRERVYVSVVSVVLQKNQAISIDQAPCTEIVEIHQKELSHVSMK